jgi:hypothetical protein
MQLFQHNRRKKFVLARNGHKDVCVKFGYFDDQHEGCLLSGFHSDVDQICALLGHYTASNDNSIPTFRDNLSVPSSRVKNFGFLNLEDGTYIWSRNFGTEVPLDAV